MRGTPRYVAGSRFKYTPDVIDFSYKNLVDAIGTAIDKQMAEDGEENFTNEVQNLNTTTLEVDYDMVMAEFNDLTQSYMAQDPTYYGPRIVEIVERHLGKGNKVGDCSRDQAQVIDLIVYDLKEIKK